MQLPETLYVQAGSLNGHDLFVNRTPSGALYRNIGAGLVPGAEVGIYRFERVVQIAAGIVETPPAVPVVTMAPSRPETS